MEISKKDLKEAYKQLKPKMGVFQVRNLTSGKLFLGSNVNLDAIWNRLRFQLNMGSHPNKGLQQDWKEQGESGFVFEIIGEIPFDEEHQIDYSREVKRLEEMYLEELQPFEERGYHAFSSVK